MGNNKARPYYCYDCRVMFTVYFTPYARKLFCPKCGDNISTKLNPYTTGKHPDTVGTKPRWTEQEKQRLVKLYNTTSLMSREMAAELGKTEKAVRRMVSRLGLVYNNSEVITLTCLSCKEVQLRRGKKHLCFICSIVKRPR